MSDHGVFDNPLSASGGVDRRQSAARWFKSGSLVALPAFVLMGLAVLLVLTNTAIFLITLTIVLGIIFEILRVGLSGAGSSQAGEELG